MNLHTAARNTEAAKKRRRDARIKEREFLELFHARDGTLKARLLRKLVVAGEEGASTVELLRYVYGTSDKSAVGKLMMVLAGIEDSIARNHLPLKVRRVREDNNVRYALMKRDRIVKH